MKSDNKTYIKHLIEYYNNPPVEVYTKEPGDIICEHNIKYLDITLQELPEEFPCEVEYLDEEELNNTLYCNSGVCADPGERLLFVGISPQWWYDYSNNIE